MALALAREGITFEAGSDLYFNLEKGEKKMTAIVESIEIARPPEEVFAYASDFLHFPEWQAGVLSVRPEGDGSRGVGAKAVVVRQAGPRRLSRTEAITELDAPRSWSVSGVGGPLVSIAKATIEPLAGGRHSRLTIALEFEGRGIGKLLAPALRRQARKQLPRNEQQLKERLERPA